MSTLADRTRVVSGASGGIGLAIAIGATHPKLPGTVHTAVTDIGLLTPGWAADVLASTGVQDLSRYGGGDGPILDIFVDKP